MNVQMEKEIIEGVLSRLIEQGLLENRPGTEKLFRNPAGADDNQEPITLEPKNTIGIKTPHNLEALKVMRKTSPARILMGRCGARQRTPSLLHFLADHAAAVDAVFLDVSDQCVEANGLFRVKTVVSSKDEYLMKPELGKKLDPETKKAIAEKCEKGVQVQIIVVDGLSSTSIEANLSDVLPSLVQGLKTEGIRVGTPFFIQYGRVGVMDEVAPLVDCDVIVEFIGERPGLITAESMSAYMAYRPNADTVEADRTVISNIHRGGMPPAEAGAHLATVVKQILTHKKAGVALSEALRK